MFDSLIERYNTLLIEREDAAIRRLNQTLEANFLSLMRRLRRAVNQGQVNAINIQSGLLRELRSLIPVFNPDQRDEYERVYRDLISYAVESGFALSEEINRRSGLNTVMPSYPLESVYAAARDARTYLTRHGDRFADAAAFIIQTGLGEGRSIDQMTGDLEQALNIPKVRAAAIARTESIKANDTASDMYYASNGVEYVLFFATSDDRTCGWCAPRAGNIYRRGSIRVPLHVACRCKRVAFNPQLAQNSTTYRAIGRRHREIVMREFTASGQRTKSGPAPFEVIEPIPVEVYMNL